MLTKGEIIMKLTANNQDMYFAAKGDIFQPIFTQMVLLKLNNGCSKYKRQFEGTINGNILKKSEVLGNWDMRHIKISRGNGLESFKNPSHNPTLHLKSIRQLWCWF